MKADIVFKFTLLALFLSSSSHAVQGIPANNDLKIIEKNPSVCQMVDEDGRVYESQDEQACAYYKRQERMASGLFKVIQRLYDGPEVLTRNSRSLNFTSTTPSWHRSHDTCLEKAVLEMEILSKDAELQTLVHQSGVTGLRFDTRITTVSQGNVSYLTASLIVEGAKTVVKPIFDGIGEETFEQISGEKACENLRPAIVEMVGKLR